ncbi:MULTISPECIES: aldo/keto reductase [unclassified Lactococcus]|uniref:aldo/keto reductase n=1 Tax=unclassified Lactococcus TaxID=2643510 RepID=UPI0011C887A6|nr:MULTISPECIES: aldo/keto reductase [unclassified Lactococcus]MQW23227.1 aldo/keto reductase [Lactococcus sp. dk101]TXK38104.1 aldo/keto reductase [Lactococcus sp. dk310]TXK49783.1 aldo/keto reductase [Lactococcus sp. dk322]
MTLTDTYTLNNGVKIPQVGFGTWQSKDGDEAYNAVKVALEAGYRHIDTAAVYGNEVSVGQAIADSGIPRDELFITTKLWGVGTTEDAAKALDDSLQKLGLDYVDLYLIHWPNPKAFRPDFESRNAAVWKAMEAALEAGKTRAIGVSNFHRHHLDKLLKTAKVVPAVNQIMVNPSDQQREIVSYDVKHNILTEAYSPLGTGRIFEIEELKALAEKYNKTVAQVVLRWSLHKGYLPLPKSVTPERIIENTQLFDFKLSVEDIAFIDGLHGKAGLASNPDEVDF